MLAIQSIEQEEWRDVPFAIGFYQVSSLGRIRSHSRGGKPQPGWTIMKGARQPAGYVKLHSLRFHGRAESWWLHRLVAFAFLGPPPFEGAEVRHMDGNPANNRADNLKWGTHTENQRDIVRHGRARHGEDNHRTTLSNTDATEILRQCRDGERQRKVAERFGVSLTTVSRIVRGLKWQTITGVKRRLIASALDDPQGSNPPAVK